MTTMSEVQNYLIISFIFNEILFKITQPSIRENENIKIQCVFCIESKNDFNNLMI